MRAISFNDCMKKLSKKEFQTWFVRSYPNEKEEWEAHYNELNKGEAPKEKTEKQ